MHFNPRGLGPFEGFVHGDYYGGAGRYRYVDHQHDSMTLSETSANDETKPNVGKSPKEVAVEQNKVLEAKTETRTRARTSSRHPPNRTVWFPNPNHPVLAASGQRRMSRNTAPGMALAPHWCPPGHTPSQRRIQWMRA
jgi:hypothetical protein